MSLNAIMGDITTVPVDAIVNAANISLLGGGGVDGVIHRAAGPLLLEECRNLDGCPTGEAKITSAYNLPANFVIHTVGPVWQGGDSDEEQLLKNCYVNSLNLAVEKEMQSISFPAISSGVYGFPLEKAAAVAISTCKEFLRDHELEITFCLFSDEALAIFEHLLKSNGESISKESRLKGALWGAIIGDALGVPFEFVNREQLRKKPVHGMQGHGSYNQPAGTWSDDSSLILCTIQSLCEVGFDPEDIMSKCLLWMKEGYMSAHGSKFDIGNATADALMRYSKGAPRNEWGCPNDWQNGNGSLMRILPLSLWVAGDEAGAAIEKSFLCSSLTHAHIRSQLACGFFTLLVRQLLSGDSLVDALEFSVKELRPYIPEAEENHFKRLLDGSILTAEEHSIESSSYVVHSLEASIYCMQNNSSFGEAVLKAVNLGDDTGTTASITGSLSGLCYGVEAIQENWLNHLAQRSMIDDILNKFVKILIN